MKKIITFLISSILVVSAFGCQSENYQTSAQKPSDTNESAQTPEETANSENESNPENVPQTDENAEDNEAPKDGNNDDEKNTDDIGTTNDIEAKLKTALPKSDLEVEEKDDNILIKGTVSSESDMKTVEKIVSQIKTTKSVKVETSVGSQNKY